MQFASFLLPCIVCHKQPHNLHNPIGLCTTLVLPDPYAFSPPSIFASVARQPSLYSSPLTFALLQDLPSPLSNPYPLLTHLLMGLLRVILF